MDLQLLYDYKLKNTSNETRNKINYIKLKPALSLLNRQTFIHKGTERKYFLIEITCYNKKIATKCSCNYFGKDLCSHVIAGIDLMIFKR